MGNSRRGGHRAPLGVSLGVTFGLTALAAAGPAAAHDLWLVPSSFVPEPGEAVAVSIRVGHDPATAEPLPHRPEWVERFVFAGPEEGEIRGAPGSDPAGYARFEAPGLYALALVSGATEHEMEVAGFERYLTEEGLEAAARPRAETVYADGVVHEAFSRSVKSLVRLVGDDGATGPGGFDRPLGLPLELVPVGDPFEPSSRVLRLRVLLYGDPVEGVPVDLGPLDPESTAVPSPPAVSDATGEVTVDLPPDTPRLLATAVVLLPAEAQPNGADGTEWHSVWTSLTWERAAELQ